MSRPRGTATTPLAAYLRELRERAGLTTAEVAQRAKRSRTTCYRAEQGTSADPGLVEAFVRACDGGGYSVRRARVLLARQSQTIRLPKGVSDKQIERAIAALTGDYR